MTASVKSGEVSTEIARLAACDGPPGVVPLNGTVRKPVPTPAARDTVTTFDSPGPSVKDFWSMSTPAGSAGTTVTVPENPLTAVADTATGADPPGARRRDPGASART